MTTRMRLEKWISSLALIVGMSSYAWSYQTLSTPSQTSDDGESLQVAQCCVVGCTECQAKHQVILKTASERALPSAHLDLTGAWMNIALGLDDSLGVTRCCAETPSDNGCCEARKYKNSCGERSCQQQVGTQDECGCESPRCENAENAMVDLDNETLGERGIPLTLWQVATQATEESMVLAGQSVTISIKQLLELQAERIRWEARAEAMESIMDNRMEALERVVAMQQENFEKILHLTTKSVELETRLAMIQSHQNQSSPIAFFPPPHASRTFTTSYFYQSPDGSVVSSSPIANLNTMRPMPVPFASSAYGLERKILSGEKLDAGPCCEEESHCCADASGTCGQANSEKPNLRSASRLEFPSNKRK